MPAVPIKGTTVDDQPVLWSEAALAAPIKGRLMAEMNLMGGSPGWRLGWDGGRDGNGGWDGGNVGMRRFRFFVESTCDGWM
ncbi:unnamed protein product [Urochloa humidicola]